jgi:hypothetical protein
MDPLYTELLGPDPVIWVQIQTKVLKPHSDLEKTKVNNFKNVLFIVVYFNGFL